MKLPPGYVPGEGVHSATGFGGKGQRMMEQMGWTKGAGLGKEGDGMTDAIVVKKKDDNSGVSEEGASSKDCSSFVPPLRAAQIISELC